MDTSKPDEIHAMVDRAINDSEGINILVNNAAVSSVPVPRAFEIKGKYTEALNKVFQMNMAAAFFYCQRVGQWMATHGGGKIVNVASTVGVAGIPNVNAYGLSKAALINMTCSSVVEWAKYRTNVNCVAPCWITTRRLERAMERSVISLGEIQKRCPMERPAEPEEVANAIFFLVSVDASFIIGITLPVDEGWLAYGHQTL